MNPSLKRGMVGIPRKDRQFRGALGGVTSGDLAGVGPQSRKSGWQGESMAKFDWGSRID